MTDDSLEDRAALIHRRFKRGRVDAFGMGFWDRWVPENISLVLVILLLFVIVVMDDVIWQDDWPSNLLGVRVPDFFAVVLVLLFLLNGWFLDQFLASKTPGEALLPTWIRGLRLLAASLPLFGLHTISLWKAYLNRGPSEPLASPDRVPDLDLCEGRRHLSSGLRVRWFYRSGFFFLWQVAGLLPLLLACSGWLMSTSLGSHRREVILGYCALLHLAGCALMMHCFGCLLRKARVPKWKRVLYRSAPFLWLFAVPGVIAGSLLLGILAAPRQTLVWKVHDRRTDAVRVPLWQGLEGTLRRRRQGLPLFAQWRRPTGLSHSAPPNRRDWEIVALYRLKTLLLAFESIGFTIFILSEPSLKTALSNTISRIFWIAVVLAGTGLMIQTVGLLARLFRVSRLGEALSRHPYGRYLLLPQTALLTGIYGAMVFMQVPIEQLGQLLSPSAALCAMIAILLFLPPSTSNAPDMALWSIFYFSLALLGGIVALAGKDGLLSFFMISAALSPLWSLGLFLAFGGWLLRPFSWRHAFDRKFPPGFRIALVLVTLTAALPLGGLAIPFWIYARHRLWPRYEPFLSDSSERR